jgi:hypothetical protein
MHREDRERRSAAAGGSRGETLERVTWSALVLGHCANTTASMVYSTWT